MPRARRTEPPQATQLSLFGETAPPVTPPRPPEPASTATPGTSAVGHYAHPRAQRETVLDGHRVAYELRRARRRSIGFVVGLDGLTVAAPRWVGLADVDRALQAKAGWILRKLQEQQERGRRLQAARVDWRDGARLPFLGRELELRLGGAAPGAVLEPAGTGPGLLRIGLPTTASGEQIRDTVQAWLQRQARRIFDERCAVYAPRLAVQPKRVSLTSAGTRWGSASRSGAIRLNWRLVHFGLPVIDYVVAHELAHLREMNHSPAFWDVVRSVLPDFEQSRGALREQVLPVFE